MAKRRANGEGTIRKRTDGRWEARYTDTRESDPQKRLKYITNKSQKVVVSKLKSALYEVSENSQLLANDNSTVAEWLDIWLNTYKINDLRDSTYESYGRHISRNINPIIGNIKLKQLTSFNIQNMYIELQKKKETGGYGLSAATIAKIKNILSGALKQAVTNRLIRDNPITGTTPPKVKDVDIRILSKEEQKQFVSVLPFYNTGNMFAAALATGMRIGELCALKISDINHEQKYINITKSAGRRVDKYTGEVSIKTDPPKTKHSIRKIPLLPSVEVILERQAQVVLELHVKAGSRWHENTLVFPTDEGNVHGLSGLRSTMERILKRAKLPHLTIHSFRHTYTTTALNAGVSAQNVARLLGHKDGATTLRFYAHYINAEAMTQLEKLEEQNISHLAITVGELEQIMSGETKIHDKPYISERIDDAAARAKNFAPGKGAEIVLSVCEDILCHPIDSLSSSDKDLLLAVLAQYTSMKRQYAERHKEHN